MSSSFVVHDSVAFNRGKKRSPLLTCPKHPDAAPIPPTLVNSHYLSSPNSVFRRKSLLPRCPSQRDDEWLRDMVPMGGSLAFDADTRSEASASSNDSATPSPTSSESSFGALLFPPSPMLRAHSTGSDASTSAGRALGGSGFGPSPHT